MTETSVTPSTAPARLLLVETGASLGTRLAAALEAEFSASPDVVELSTGRAAIDLLRTSKFDVVIADLTSLGDLGERTDDRIGKLARAAAGALIIVLADDASISIAMSAMRAGAHDCVGTGCDGAALIERLGQLGRRHGKSRVVTRSALLPATTEVEPVPSMPTIPVMRDLVLPMWRQEQRIIESAIQSFAGNIAMAAAALELSPSTIYRKRQAWAELNERRAAMPSAVSAR